MGIHGPYGARRSDPRPGLADHRAWTAAPVTLPAEYADPIMPTLAVDDQAGSDMCMGAASAKVREWWRVKLGLPRVPLSFPYIYARGHQIAGDTAEGMQAVWAMEALERYGACALAEDALQPSTETVAQAEAASPPSLDKDAAENKIAASGPVDPHDAAALGAAIMHAPVIVIIPVYASMGVENPVQDGFGGWVALPPADLANAQVDGLHAVVAHGWRTWNGHLQRRLRNSWGAGYAMGGDVWLDASHPIEEAWSMTCALDPRCVYLHQTAAQARAWAAAHPDVPAAWRADLEAYALRQDAAAAGLGCT
ncbi:MAG: hypothetical protein KGK07_07225 [Chloroflexota bacterium]|nr:hypothetical protein [Chloroflexota bacterium]